MRLPINTIARPYRGLSVQEVDFDLTEVEIKATLLGRVAYRRTEFIALRHGSQVALVQIATRDRQPLFSPIVEIEVLATPDRAAWVDSPGTDVGNATEIATAALASGADADAFVVIGQFRHVNFIWHPTMVTIGVTEVVPPWPPKLVSMAAQAIAFDEELPPIALVSKLLDIDEIRASSVVDTEYLLPCKGAASGDATSVSYLDQRPTERRDWTLIGCERSAQVHREFYGDQPPTMSICPMTRPDLGQGKVLAKCCLLERGVERRGDWAVVPWGANLDEIRDALRQLTDLPPVATGLQIGRSFTSEADV